MNLIVLLTYLETQHTMSDSICYQKLSLESGPNVNKLLIYHHTAFFDW